MTNGTAATEDPTGNSVPGHRRHRPRRLVGWLPVPAVILAVAIVAVNLTGDPPAPTRGDHSAAEPSPAMLPPVSTVRPAPTAVASPSRPPSRAPSRTHKAPPPPRPKPDPSPSIAQQTVRYEAEQARLSGAEIDTDRSGTRYANFGSFPGASAQWSLRQRVAGRVTVRLRYASGDFRDRPMIITADDHWLTLVDFQGTGGWSDWRVVSVAISVPAGTGTIRISTVSRRGGPNLDYLEIAP